MKKTGDDSVSSNVGSIITHVKNSISYNTKESCLIGAISLRFMVGFLKFQCK